MANDWLDDINSGKMTGVAFTDLRKALDTVNHGVLIKKIRDIGVSDLSVKIVWILSLRENSKSMV